MGQMLLAIVFVACSGGSDDAEPIAEGTPGEAAAEAAEEPSTEPQAGFALATTYLRNAPTTNKYRDDPDNPGKKVRTYVATVYRGNELTVLETQDEFVKVVLEDGSGNQGWLQTKRVTTAEGAKLATIKEEVKTFSRPELLSLNTTEKLAPGSVLVVTQDQGKFVEVDWPKSQWSSASTWVLANTLVTNEDDVAAAQLITKALYMREDDAEKAKPIEELAREQFAGNSLLTLLDPPEPEPGEEGEEGAEAPEGGNLNPPPQ
ncbi:MAG: hypothetical protein AAF211_06770 [Myxococcota bacterium]